MIWNSSAMMYGGGHWNNSPHEAMMYGGGHWNSSPHEAMIYVGAIYGGGHTFYNHNTLSIYDYFILRIEFSAAAVLIWDLHRS